MPREIHHRYADPTDLVWLACAREIGMEVARTPEVYASWDGARTLSIATADDFDADDSIAQYVLHEICHHLVQGPDSWREPDWGLDNDDAAVAVREHACHRLQAALAERWGLRALLAPTTDWRPYWDALPPDPLAAGADPAIPLARVGWERATTGPLAPALHRALERTAAIASLVRAVAPPDTLWARTFDCGTCGACCREGFDAVDVGPGEPIALAHPELVADSGWGPQLPRPGGRCVALCGGGDAPYRCRVYDLRPRNCAELEPGGEACLTARRRVGLSA